MGWRGWWWPVLAGLASLGVAICIIAASGWADGEPVNANAGSSIMPTTFDAGSRVMNPRAGVVVAFHQDWIERAWRDLRPVDLETDLIESPLVELDPTDRRAVIRQVLQHTPATAVVYPSEQYYYFKLYAGHRLISGNLRFCDAQQGLVHFGYFDQHDGQFLETGTIRDGVNGEVELDGQRVRLVFEGIERTFELHQSWKSSQGLKLEPNETLVSGILDESGYCFWLIYHPQVRRLYFVLNESRLPERHHEIVSGGARFLIGQQSRFVFFVDPASRRKILVGVQEQQIRENNYFDGPFDQVPPDLPLKPILEHIYPYVKERGGIDQHGNFLRERHARVAISPYSKYSETSLFLSEAIAAIWPFPQSESQPIAFLDLVYESKMDFHLTLQEASRSSASDPEADSESHSSSSGRE